MLNRLLTGFLAVAVCYVVAEDGEETEKCFRRINEIPRIILKNIYQITIYHTYTYVYKSVEEAKNVLSESSDFS